jgi:two-component system chemotaxis response regulator CheB
MALADPAQRVIRVLVVDDSATIRKLLTAMLEADPQIRVIGTAADGEAAVQQALLLKPDLITMDIQMPLLDGLEATRRILAERPTPIIVVSAMGDDSGNHPTFDAMQAGALDVIKKPSGLGSADFQLIAQQLVTSVKLLAEVKVVRRRVGRVTAPITAPLPVVRHKPAVLAMGASTGGPAALNAVLRGLPDAFPLPVLVVQHIAAGFLPGLLAWLQRECRLPLQMAQAGQALTPGVVSFAPDDHHLVVAARGRLGLNQDPPLSHVRPSATALLQSVARVYGAEAIGVVLTGMGDDGALGLQALHARGGVTIAQDEASSVVYGMPKVAVELGAVDYVRPLDRIAATIMTLL